MNTYLFAAACLLIIVGLIHSILGEVLIFRCLRVGGLVPSNGGNILKERNVRILWASWHLVTLLGWAIAAVLLQMSMLLSTTDLPEFIYKTSLIVMLLASVLVLYATKGRHPGWIGLMAVAILIGFSG